MHLSANRMYPNVIGEAGELRQPVRMEHDWVQVLKCSIYPVASNDAALVTEKHFHSKTKDATRLNIGRTL